MAGSMFARAAVTVKFNHPAKRGVVTVPGKPNEKLATGTLNSILKQAGLK